MHSNVRLHPGWETTETTSPNEPFSSYPISYVLNGKLSGTVSTLWFTKQQTPSVYTLNIACAFVWGQRRNRILVDSCRQTAQQKQACFGRGNIDIWKLNGQDWKCTRFPWQSCPEFKGLPILKSGMELCCVGKDIVSKRASWCMNITVISTPMFYSTHLSCVVSTLSPKHCEELTMYYVYILRAILSICTCLYHSRKTGVGHDGTCLQSQYSGGRGKRIVSLRSAWIAQQVHDKPGTHSKTLYLN